MKSFGIISVNSSLAGQELINDPPGQIVTFYLIITNDQDY